MQLSEEEVRTIMGGLANDTMPDDLSHDSNGQLILHLGVYRWEDNTYHDEPEAA